MNSKSEVTPLPEEKQIQVELAERSYPIVIGQDLLDQPHQVRPYVQRTQVLLVTKTTVASLYLEKVRQAFADYQVQTVILPDGEAYKDLTHLNQIYDAAIAHHFDRHCTFVALGGGVVGDMTGFAAASYQRGVRFIQIPTTLLAQVDSSVGGKTGVNHPQGKNMIGAFHQPELVLIDVNTLNTLPDRELSAGLAEVIKYGLIVDAPFFEWLSDNIPDLLARVPDTLMEAVQRSCANKAAIVAKDEKEAGLRALFNLGHTFGHAIEAGMGYGVWLHGEAVAAGMMQAVEMSKRLGDLTDQDQARIASVIQQARLPLKPPEALSPSQFMTLMAADKKVQAGRIRLVLLRSIGQAYVTGDYPDAILQATLAHYR